MRQLVLSAFFAFAVSPVIAADEYRWLGEKIEDGAVLRYAIPESDAVQLDFQCERKSGKLIVTLEHEPIVAKDGVKVDFLLKRLHTGPKDEIRIRATGHRLELDDKFILEGETRMLAKLRRILEGGGTLIVRVEDGALEIPLKGAAAAARHLFAACPS